MPTFITSPNMGLPIPIPTVTPGPDYAQNEQSCFLKIDTHNHTTGNGAPVPVSGLDINGTLPMNSNSISDCAGVTLVPQVATPSNNTVYDVSGDLYFRNGSGSVVQITNGPSVAVSGAIGFTGLPSGTASASYLAIPAKFVFQSATSTSAGVDCGPIIIRDQVASGNATSIYAFSGLASDYNLTLPPANPAATSFLTVSSTGAMDCSIPVSLGIDTANIANDAITTAKIADSNVTTIKIADQNVTPVKRSPGAYSRSSVSFGPTGISPAEQTIGSVTITTTAANKVAVAIFGVESIGGYYGGGGLAWVLIRASGPSLVSTVVAVAQPGASGGSPGGISASFPIIGTITLPSIGTYTFTATIRSDSGSHTGYVGGCFLSAAELG